MTNISFSREPLRTTEVLGSFGQVRRRTTRVQIRRLDDLPRLRAFGEDQEIILLRTLVAAGLVLPGIGRWRSQAGADSKGCRKK